MGIGGTGWEGIGLKRERDVLRGPSGSYHIVTHCYTVISYDFTVISYDFTVISYDFTVVPYEYL